MKTNNERTKELAVQVFNYLQLHNHIGKENGIVRLVLARLLDMGERDLRRAMKEINESTDFEKLVSTNNCVYICATEDEGVEAVCATYKQAVALFKKAKTMERKMGLNCQIKIPLGDDYKDFVETFTRGK